MIADFLTYLRDRRALALPTIKGFRSALSPIWKEAGVDVDASEAIARLFKSFQVEVPKKQLKAPPWDINIVLSALKSAPFEPLDSCAMKWLTMKTLFLVALGTANRIGEIQALSKVVPHGQDWDSMTLAFLPEFRAKTETADRKVPREFPVKALINFTDEEEDLLMCPVRAIRTYLERTKSIPDRPRNLFVAPSNPEQPISKNACSWFLRQTIKMAYEKATDETMALARVKAHDIRAVASSILFNINHSITEVLDLGIWRSNTVFASYSLREPAHSYLDVSSLSALTVARTTLDLSSQ